MLLPHLFQFANFLLDLFDVLGTFIFVFSVETLQFCGVVLGPCVEREDEAFYLLAVGGFIMTLDELKCSLLILLLGNGINV